MSWYDTKQQRRANRGEKGSYQREQFRQGHTRRSRGFVAVIERKTDTVVAVAQNGCFGNLAWADRDTYDEWAAGTRGAL